ncbi:hypothetical protein [Halegenticoccus soli]|uniref:hypothetical protein n=1 Tax=Halegenticoccus soli TaxID=1985678 RepID=UPI000C6CF648|nr:hypothetical protein [Halegenticoccus soli]
MKRRHVLGQAVGLVAVSGVARAVTRQPDGETDESANGTAVERSAAASTAGAARQPDDGGGGPNGGPRSGQGGQTGSDRERRRFRLALGAVEECGPGCRDVAVTIRNTGPGRAENVRIRARMSVRDDVLWRDRERLGPMASGERIRRTKRVRVGPLDADKIRRNDGYVRVTATVRWDGGRETFARRRKVA